MLAAYQFSDAMEHESYRLALVSKHTVNSIVITDGRGRLQWANAAFLRRTGLTQERVLERDFCDLLEAMQIESEIVTQFRSAFAAGTRLKLDVPRFLPGGETQWATVEVSPAPDAAGQLRQFIIIGTDITETKRAQFALDANQRFLKELINVIPGMVGYWDGNLHCRYANSAYLSWFGRTADQMQGIAMQELLGPELFSQNESYIRAALRGEYQKFERTLTKSDGSTGYTWAHYVPDIYLDEVRGLFCNGLRHYGNQKVPAAACGAKRRTGGSYTRGRNGHPRQKYIPLEHEPRIANPHECHAGIRTADRHGQNNS